MNNVEKLLSKEKDKLETLQIPPDFEQRLGNTLNSYKKPLRKKPRFTGWLVASFVLLIFVFSYNYDAIAYYGKKMLGFDNILSGTLKDINKLGKGQEIGQTFISKKGTKLTLDGLIWDENRLVIFYTIVSPKTNDLREIDFRPREVKGLFSSYHVEGGHGQFNDDFTELKGIFDFESPSAFEKNLKLEFALDENGATEYGSFKFRIDKSKALGYQIKEKINKTVTLDNTKVKLTEIIASPTLTVVNGTIALPIKEKTDYVTSPTIELELWVDGKQLSQAGAGIGSSLTGYSFNVDFDGLPDNFDNMELRLKGVTVCEKVNATFPLSLTSKGKTITIAGQEIMIKDIILKDNKTELSLLYNEHVSLLDVSFEVKGQRISLTKAEVIDHYKTSEGQLLKELMIIFPTEIDKAKLRIENISYPKESNQVIPLNK